MENLLLSFNVVFPLFVLISFGLFLRRVGLIDDHTQKVMNVVTFRAFFPILLFVNIYKMDLSAAFDPNMVLFTFGTILIIFLFLFFFIPRIEPDNKKRGVMIQAIFRSNFIIFGIPVTTVLFGEEKLGIIALMLAVTVPFFNVLAVFALEWFRNKSVNPKMLIKSLSANPLILGALAGILMKLLGAKLPYAILKPITDISNISTPLALIILGASFKLKSARANIKQIVISVLGRLVVVPLFALSAALFLGFRGVQLSCLLSIFASPPAISSYTMAEQMGGDGELAGEIIVFASLCAIVTMFLWIFAFKQLGFF